MITFTMTYPNGREITRRVYASQAQMIINRMRADGITVVIVENPTNIIVK